MSMTYGMDVPPELGANWGAHGDPAESGAQASLMESLRVYLLAIARESLDADLTAKVGASDLVQETFLAARRGMASFRGKSRDDFKAWLRIILLNQLANTRRRYRATDRRRVHLEIPLAPGNDGLADDATSALGRVVRIERNEALERAVMGLPEKSRMLLEWHHREGLTFAEIGGRLGITAEAARKLWGRALLRLRQSMRSEP